MEVYHNSEWSTVCDYYYYYWNFDEGQVVCRQLGFGPPIRSRAFYGQGSSQFCIDEVHCTGTELKLEDCSRDEWRYRNRSTYYQDIGVQCSASDGNN